MGNKTIVGVIGGNGVAATNRLCDLIEMKFTKNGAFRDAHHPEMVVWQATRAPSRSMFLEGRGPDWRPEYIEIAKKLKAAGCSVGCMCCNTAHYALNDIENASGLKFINLLEEVAKRTLESRAADVEIFCSDGARKFELYSAVFSKICPDVRVHYPGESRQCLVTKVICSVKSAERFSELTSPDHPLNILTGLIESSQYPVILGCTDLRVAYSPNQSIHSKVLVDSLECLADSIVSLFSVGQATKHALRFPG